VVIARLLLDMMIWGGLGRLNSKGKTKEMLSASSGHFIVYVKCRFQ
jgi:hypothetical protein